MKRRDLLAHLQRHGCHYLREGGSHTIWQNAANGRISAIPRHREILEKTVRRICGQLGIPAP